MDLDSTVRVNATRSLHSMLAQTTTGTPTSAPTELLIGSFLPRLPQ